MVITLWNAHDTYNTERYNKIQEDIKKKDNKEEKKEEEKLTEWFFYYIILYIIKTNFYH